MKVSKWFWNAVEKSGEVFNENINELVSKCHRGTSWEMWQQEPVPWRLLSFVLRWSKCGSSDAMWPSDHLHCPPLPRYIRRVHVPGALHLGESLWPDLVMTGAGVRRGSAPFSPLGRGGRAPCLLPPGEGTGRRHPPAGSQEESPRQDVTMLGLWPWASRLRTVKSKILLCISHPGCGIFVTVAQTN